MFNKYTYSIIIGPPNSGKTEWFLEQNLENKLIISVVDIQYILPLNKNIYDYYRSKCNFLNLKKIFTIKVDETMAQDLISSDQLVKNILEQDVVDFFEDIENKSNNICIDEIHFFDKTDLFLLDYLLNKLKNLNIYFTMLPQSDNNKFLSNTVELFLNCNNIILITNNCHGCKKPTIQASTITPRNEFNNICDKNMFVTMCKKCKEAQFLKIKSPPI
jgi:thymidine kinase